MYESRWKKEMNPICILLVLKENDGKSNKSCS